MSAGPADGKVTPVRQKVVGIVSVNSIAYIRHLLDNLRDQSISVILRSADDHERAALAGVDEIVTPEPGTGWIEGKVELPKGDVPAQFAFTSGTEGKPKGVVLTQRNLSDAVERLSDAMQIDETIREYVGSPATYSFGYGRFRCALSAGGAAYLPPRGFDPMELAEMLRRDEINAISAVPTMWRLLLSAPHRIGNLGTKVRWIEIGSQYMSRAEKEALKNLFPNAVIIQHYGLTEASRSTFLRVHEEDGDRLETVGQATGATEVKIAPDGRIAIRGPHVAQGYLIDGTLAPMLHEDGWFHTNDLGRIDQGYLSFLGRADDVINSGGLKVSPEALEAKIFNALGIEGGLAICRMPDPLRGDGFLVAVERNLNLDKGVVQKEIVSALAQQGISALSSIKIVEVDLLPRTATGKVQRRALTEEHGAVESEITPVQAESKLGVIRREAALSRNLIVTMLVSGLWHGPAWTFVSWGASHGIMLAIERLLGRTVGQIQIRSRTLRSIGVMIQILIAFVVVAASRIFFRSNDLEQAGLVISRVIHGGYSWRAIDAKSTLAFCAFIIVGVLVAEVLAERGFWRRVIARRRILRTALAIAVLLITLLIGDFTGGRFIYVRF